MTSVTGNIKIYSFFVHWNNESHLPLILWCMSMFSWHLRLEPTSFWRMVWVLTLLAKWQFSHVLRTALSTVTFMAYSAQWSFLIYALKIFFLYLFLVSYICLQNANPNHSYSTQYCLEATLFSSFRRLSSSSTWDFQTSCEVFVFFWEGRSTLASSTLVSKAPKRYVIFRSDKMCHYIQWFVE